jgi:hypothetical protein
MKQSKTVNWHGSLPPSMYSLANYHHPESETSQLPRVVFISQKTHSYLMVFQARNNLKNIFKKRLN